MAAGRDIAPDWHKEFDVQPKRTLGFRFGYPDHDLHGHLIIMRRPANAAGTPTPAPAPASPTK
jgi:hypothetical protein